MKGKKRYYCVVNKPAPMALVPHLMECAESQGWDTSYVLFAGHMPVQQTVSILKPNQPGQVPVAPFYYLIFSKWSEAGKRPAMPVIDLKKDVPPTEMPKEAAPDESSGK